MIITSLTAMRPITLINLFVDSNILIYLTDNDQRKKQVVQEIVLEKPFINSQVAVEVANVYKRKFRFTKFELLNLWQDMLNDYKIAPTNHRSIQKAIQLVERYDFQLFDALIVADALRAGCTILYSEDMQHNMLVENKLTIINPFL